MVSCIICEYNNSNSLFVKNEYELVRCRNDGHIFVSNPPSLEELSALYSREYFEGKAKEGYPNVFENREEPIRRAKKKLHRLQRLLPSGKVLDVGCGPGFFLQEASSSYQVSGCDISEAAADYAMKEFGLDVEVTDFLDFENGGPYDAITMFNFLEHTLNPRSNLRKAHSLIREGGFLALALPNIDSPMRYIQGKDWKRFEFPEHLHLFSKSNLAGMLEELGFTSIKSKYSEANFFRDINHFYAQKK